ncbi:TPA: DMT family transporter [Citrobacter freundii]
MMLIKMIVAMMAFAANSVLCRLALKGAHIDAISFSCIRLTSGAVALFILLQLIAGRKKPAFNLINATLLAIYVFAFSVAYISLGTATGALLLFGTVQLVMTAWGVARKEKLTPLKIAGMLAALAGIGLLLLPGAESPPASAAVWMIISGIAWAIYSITGKQVVDASASTTGNFILAVPLAAIVFLFDHSTAYFDSTGLLLGVVSGAITSGGAYLLWYSLLPKLAPTTASTLQLSVPCLATLGGIIFMGEPLDLRIAASTAIILSGIGIVILADKRKRLAQRG